MITVDTVALGDGDHLQIDHSTVTYTIEILLTIRPTDECSTVARLLVPLLNLLNTAFLSTILIFPGPVDAWRLLMLDYFLKQCNHTMNAPLTTLAPGRMPLS